VATPSLIRKEARPKMSHSEAIVLRSPCPQCGITANRHVYSIVSADEHPELIKAIQAGKLNRFECGTCGRVERVDAPVLIYFPGRDRPLLFSPPASAARSVEPQPSPLADIIRDAAERHLRIVPRSALRATMAGELVFPDPPDDLVAALGAYLQTVDRAEARHVIEAYPILLSEAADAWFVEQLNPGATPASRHDPDGLRMRHALLRQCRELGVAGAFTHLAQRLLENTSTLAGTEDGESAIRRVREALSLIRREEAPQVWTLLQVSLGNCLLLRTAGSPLENVEQSIAAYKAALRELGPDNLPELWASATACLANAYVERLTDDRAGNLERAIELYEQTLQFRTPDRGKAVRAITMNDLAVAYRLRHEDIKIKNLDRSVGLCEEALSQLSPEEAPREWAILHVTLANALSEIVRDYGNNELAAESLNRAIDCYRQALAIHRSLKDSRDAAGTLINLANALAERGRRSAELSGRYRRGDSRP
jgi:tetratricopeptide (TPR) repeat protein